MGSGVIVLNFISWNQYNPLIVDLVKKHTGKEITIKGDIKIGILPSPTLIVTDISLPNKSSYTKINNFLEVQRLEINLNLIPLVLGKVIVSSIELQKPEMNLVVPTSSQNEKRNTSKSSPRVTQKIDQESTEKTAFALEKKSPSQTKLQIQNFIVKNGRVNLIGDLPNYIKNITNINGKFRLASLEGPMDASGKASVGGLPIIFSGSAGKIIQGRTLPITFFSKLEDNSALARFEGAISELSANPKIRGKMSAETKNLGHMVKRIFGNLQTSIPINRDFKFSSQLELHKETVVLEDTLLQTGKTKILGSAKIDFGNKKMARITLSSNSINLDQMLQKTPNDVKVIDSSSETKKTTKINEKKTTQRSYIKNFSYSSELELHLDLNIKKIRFRDDKIENGKLSVVLTKDEITINQISANIPGQSNIAFFGFINTQGQQPILDGTLDLRSKNLGKLVTWVRDNTANFGKDARQSLQLSSAIKATPTSINLYEIKVNLDGSKLRGSTLISLGEKNRIIVDLNARRLDIDKLVNKNKMLVLLQETKSQSELGGTVTAKTVLPTPSTDKNSVNLFGRINKFEIKVKTRFKQLRFKQVEMKNTELLAELRDGRLSVEKLSILNVLDCKVMTSGVLSNLASPNFSEGLFFDDLNIDIEGNFTKKLAKALGVNKNNIVNKIGKFNIVGNLNSNKTNLVGIVSINTMGGTLKIKGPFNLNGDLDKFSGEVSLIHRRPLKLLRQIGVNYQPRIGKLGKLLIKGKIDLNKKLIKFRDASAILNKPILAGNIAISIDGPVPKIDGKLETGAIFLDNFLPSIKKAKSRPLGGYLQLATWDGKRDFISVASSNDNRNVGSRKRWSKKKIDLTFLRLLDANLDLQIPLFVFGNIALEKTKTQIKLNSGKLKIPRLESQIYQGTLNATADVDTSKSKTSYDLSIKVNRLDLEKAAMFFEQSNIGSGKVNFNGTIKTRGNNELSLISSMNGSGSLSILGYDVSSKKNPNSPLSAIYSLFNSFSANLSLIGKQGNKGLADLSGDFNIKNGKAKFSALKLSSSLGSGNAKGTIDLPNWKLATSGTLNLSQNPLFNEILRGNEKPIVPFKVFGNIDNPQVRLDTRSLTRNGFKLPGKLGERLNKKIKNRNIGGILEKLTSPRQKPTNRETDRVKNKEPSSTQPKPEDLIKNMLRGLLR